MTDVEDAPRRRRLAGGLIKIGTGFSLGAVQVLLWYGVYWALGHSSPDTLGISVSAALAAFLGTYYVGRPLADHYVARGSNRVTA